MKTLGDATDVLFYVEAKHPPKNLCCWCTFLKYSTPYFVYSKSTSVLLSLVRKLSRSCFYLILNWFYSFMIPFFISFTYC